MIANALAMPLRSPTEALADSMLAAFRRLCADGITPAGPVVHMDGRHGTLRDIYAEDGQVMVSVMLDNNALEHGRAGYWSRSIL